MDDSPRQFAKRVLEYLEDMIKLSERQHRPDMRQYYLHGWEAFSEAVYGKLSARREIQVPPHPEKPKEASRPVWMVEKYSKPLRRVVGRLDEHALLECGHRHPRPLMDSETAKWRRCSACLRQSQAAAKKPPAPADTSIKEEIG